MNIQFHGGARCVTGSMHRLEVGGKRFLLECGLFQGKRDEAEAKNRNFPFRPSEIDAVVLSHAHIDHSGNLPGLVRQGFRGPIFATPATADLGGVLLRDSAMIQERDVEYVNFRRQEQGLPPRFPLYRLPDAEAAAERFEPVRYWEPKEILPGVTLTFLDAGHILGSAIVSLRLREQDVERRLVFTGDLGVKDAPILRDPEPAGAADVFVTEGTYGDRDHGKPEALQDSLFAVLHRTFERGGRVVIPAFAVGRTQLVIHTLRLLWEEGRLPNIPVYVDSPLAVNATEVFRRHPECYDEEMMEEFRRGNPFGFDRLTYIQSVEESKALNDVRGPCVILSASGMCEHGRILHHLAAAVGSRRNTILIVGYQARETLGRRFVEGARTVRIFGEEHVLEAEVAVLDGFSAHADRAALLEYASPFAREGSSIYVVHADPAPGQALVKALEALGGANVRFPKPGESFDL